VNGDGETVCTVIAQKDLRFQGGNDSVEHQLLQEVFWLC